MGIDEFSKDHKKKEGSHLDNGDRDVRPRVSEQTHQNIKEFANQAGLDVSEGYDYIIGASLSDQSLLEDILTHDKEYADNLSSSEKELLEDVAVKCEELGHFPERQDINADSSMHGFPMYIINLGKTERIKELILEYYPDKASADI